MEALSNMTVGQIIEGAIQIFVVLSAFIELTPIKLNPWSKILKWIGAKLNGDLVDKVDAMETKLNKLTDNFNEAQAVDARVRILRFGDELRVGTPHTKEHFEQITTDIDNYDAYCETHPGFKNSMTVLTSQYIKDIYNESLKSNSFLK